MTLSELYKVLPTSITIKIYCLSNDPVFTGYSRDIPVELMDREVLLVMPRYGTSLAISLM